MKDPKFKFKNKKVKLVIIAKKIKINIPKRMKDKIKETIAIVMIKTANKVNAANKAKIVKIITKDQLPIKLENIKFNVINMAIMDIKSNNKAIDMSRNTTTTMSLNVDKDKIVKNNAKDNNKDNTKDNNNTKDKLLMMVMMEIMILEIKLNKPANIKPFMDKRTKDNLKEETIKTIKVDSNGKVETNVK